MKTQLDVHHIRYISGCEAWDYDYGDLVMLCHKCHEGLHDWQDPLKSNCFSGVNFLSTEGQPILALGGQMRAAFPITSKRTLLPFAFLPFSKQKPPAKQRGATNTKTKLDLTRLIRDFHKPIS